MTRHRLEVVTAFFAGVLLTLAVGGPVQAGGHNCRPAWKCNPPTARVSLPAPTATSLVPTVAPTSPPVPTPPPTASAYSLDEECSGPGLNPAWSALYGPGDPGDRLDTDTMGDLRQVSVAGGICTLTVERKQTPSGRPFAGAAMAPYGTFGQRFGTYEARIRYDEAKGTWPSLFLLPVGQKGPYPEIDVFEAYGDPACLGPGALVSAVHYAGEMTSDYRVVPVSSSSGWHVQRLSWTAAAVTFSIDGAVTFTTAAHVPQVAMYPIVVAGVGANNPACRADATTPSPLVLQLDYLRVSP